jgi:transposase
VKNIICATQDADHSLRLSDVATAVKKKKQPVPSLSAVCRILQKHTFTTKQLYQIPEARNSDKVKQKRKEWVEEIGPTLNAENTTFIDESPFSFCITRSRGRSRRGKKAVVIIPQIKGKNHTVIAAISPLYGLIHYEIKVAEPEYEFLSKRKGSKKKKIKRQGVTRDIFRQFLLNLLELPMFHSPSSSSSSSSSAPQKYTLVYDNAKIHKGDIDEVIFSSGHTPQPLCAWSPALNPIEYVFSKWKIMFRSLPHSSDSLVDRAIAQAARKITSSDCMHYFEHTKSLYKKCLALEDL